MKKEKRAGLFVDNLWVM